MGMQEGFVCNLSDMSESFQAAVPENCLPAQALSTQNGGDATKVAQVDVSHGQGERLWLCTDASLGRVSNPDSRVNVSNLSGGGMDIHHAAMDCSSHDSMPTWLRERVVRRGDANPAMEFQREERPGQRALIVVRSLDGEVVAQIEEQEFDDNLSETSDCTEVDIESSASGLAMAQFLSEMIRQREASRTEAEGNDRVA
eukprot:TRINITY_DN7234_c1_g1_i10.p1 TRINITY_DN7234_c1_g1~~TRINITY_DN7234_c1_g1_i10.p1  ORF type:complete len:231 (-),score=41.37 TRINITY_DN7234_c1_g1_i10:312-908(-)